MNTQQTTTGTTAGYAGTGTATGQPLIQPTGQTGSHGAAPNAGVGTHAQPGLAGTGTHAQSGVAGTGAQTQQELAGGQTEGSDAIRARSLALEREAKSLNAQSKELQEAERLEAAAAAARERAVNAGAHPSHMHSTTRQ